MTGRIRSFLGDVIGALCVAGISAGLPLILWAWFG